MKLRLNGGDWATIAFFALAVILGCYARTGREATTPSAPTAIRGQAPAR